MKASQLKRVRLLLNTLHQAQDWRETFEAKTEKTHSIVGLADMYMTDDEVAADGREINGFTGQLEMPRDVAIWLMHDLEKFVRGDLRDLGIIIEPESEK